MIGGPILIVTGTAVMFAGNEPSSALATVKNVSALPEILWELFLGVYCTVWGFRRQSPILSDETPVVPDTAAAAMPA
jgi:hypothetical protein